jgi:hypothetical protein
MLKLYQYAMGLAAIVLAVLCVQQRKQIEAMPPAAPRVAKPVPRPMTHAEPVSLAPAPAVAPAPVAVAATSEGDDAESAAMDIVSDLLTNRKHLDTIRAFSSPELDSLYAPLFRSLGLSPEDIDLFKDLVTARKVAQAELRIREQEAETEADLLEVQDQRTRAMAWFDQRMRDLLGPGLYEAVESYDKSLAERTMLIDYKQGLDNVGRGLSYEQEDRLIHIMYDQRKMSPSMDALFAAGASTFEGAGESDALVREFDAWHSLVVLKCQGILSKEQIAALDAQLATQSASLKYFFRSQELD